MMEEETGKKAFIGTDSSGNVYVVTPKDKTEAKKMEREIKKTGTLAGAKYQEADEDVRTGISQHGRRSRVLRFPGPFCHQCYPLPSRHAEHRWRV